MEVLTADLASELVRALDQLEPRERDIVERYYGLGDRAAHVPGGHRQPSACPANGCVRSATGPSPRSASVARDRSWPNTWARKMPSVTDYDQKKDTGGPSASSGG